MPIEPRVDLEGPQLAGWTPRATSPADHEVQEESEVAVPMPDGVVLRADVFRPRGPGRYPALVSWSAYPRYIQTSGAPGRTDLIGATFSEGFVYFDIDAPPYAARNTLHAGKDNYLEISVRPS